MTGAYTAAAELEAVSVAVTVAPAVLCEAIAEGYTIPESYNSDRTGSFFCVEVPAVVRVIV